MSATPTIPPGADAAAAAAQASMMALEAAQTNPAALDPYGAGDQTAINALMPALVVLITFIVLNTVFLVLRFFTVLKLRKRRIALAWDDWFLCMAFPFVIGVNGIGIWMIHQESKGRALAHEPIVQPWRLVPLIKSTMALAEVGLPAMVFTRYSVLTLYLRLFTDRTVRVVSYLLILLYTLYWIAFAFAAIFQCTPVEYYWTRALPGTSGTCWDIKFSRSVSPPNIVFDAVMILLPLHFIWRLRISAMRKIGLTCIIFTGIGAFVITVVRTVILSGETDELTSPAHTNDFLLRFTLEPSLYFITACLPAMLPLFRLCVPGKLRRTPNRAVGPIASSSMRSPRSGLATNSSGQGFLRLRDDASPNPSAAQAHGNARNSKLSTLSVHEMENNLEMDDLKKFTQGDGIIVQTEITVTWTTEERIEEILDLY